MRDLHLSDMEERTVQAGKAEGALPDREVNGLLEGLAAGRDLSNEAWQFLIAGEYDRDRKSVV